MSLNTEPAWYQQWIQNNTVSKPIPIVSVKPQENSITLRAGPTEMLMIAEDGFYVRGNRVPVDDRESMAVYTAFSEWLNWQILNRNN